MYFIQVGFQQLSKLAVVMMVRTSNTERVERSGRRCAMRVFKVILLSLLLLCVLAPSVLAQDALPTALLPFAERNVDEEGQGEIVVDLLFANLVMSPEIVLVDRESFQPAVDRGYRGADHFEFTTLAGQSAVVRDG